MSKPVQAPPAYLAAPIDATQTSFSVRGLKDSRGVAITSMIGTLMHATIEPRSTLNQEIISFTGVTDLGGGLVTLTGITRNIRPRPPYDAVAGAVAHASGVEFILTDTAKMWAEYLNANETATINALHTYAVRPRVSGSDTDPSAVATKQDLLDAALSPGAIGNVSPSAVAAESVDAQKVVWLDPAVGKWRVANGNVLAELEGVEMGIALGAAIIDDPILPGVAMLGRVGGFTGLDVGPVYVADNGDVSDTPGTISRQIGVAISDIEIIFDPYFAMLPTTAGISFLNGVTGMVIPYAGSAAPSGFLLCNGAEISRTTYAGLFSVIGTTFGAGNGTTTFNVPDTRGRSIIGVGTGEWKTDFTLTSTAVPYASSSTTDLITAVGHGLSVGDAIYLYNTGGAGAMANLAIPYYVYQVPSADTFYIALTPTSNDYLQLNTATGTNTYRKVPNITVPSNTVLYSGTAVLVESNGGTLPTAQAFGPQSGSYGVDGSGNISKGANDLPQINEKIYVHGQSSTDFVIGNSYYVISRDVALGTFTVSATQGGSIFGSGNTGSINWSLVFTFEAGQTFYAIRKSATVIQVAGTRADAIFGVPLPAPILSGGTGTFKVTLTARTLAEKGGEETHVMTIPELVRHRHGLFTGSAGTGITSGDNSTVTDNYTEYEGSSAPFNVMNPYLGFNLIIKT